jgi:hypothetical protein
MSSRPPYSKLLAYARIGYPTPPSFLQVTVPVGVVWIVRDADFIAQGNTSLYFSMNAIHVRPPDAGASTFVHVFTYNGPCDSVGVAVQWRGRQVLEAGDILQVSLGSFSGPSQLLDCSISGYELQAP